MLRETVYWKVYKITDVGEQTESTTLIGVYTNPEPFVPAIKNWMILLYDIPGGYSYGSGKNLPCEICVRPAHGFVCDLTNRAFPPWKIAMSGITDNALSSGFTEFNRTIFVDNQGPDETCHWDCLTNSKAVGGFDNKQCGPFSQARVDPDGLGIWFDVYRYEFEVRLTVVAGRWTISAFISWTADRSGAADVSGKVWWDKDVTDYTDAQMNDSQTLDLNETLSDAEHIANWPSQLTILPVN